MTPEPKESLAECFHNLYEKYAPEFGYETRKDTKKFDPESPNGLLMTKVCHEIISSTLKEAQEEYKDKILATIENCPDCDEDFRKYAAKHIKALIQ